MSGHTPGPWHWSTTHLGRAFDIEAESGANIGLIYSTDYETPEEGKTNARLIAAAPDLLKALKWAETALAPFSKEPAEKSGINMIRAAIAKAEGK